jgi:YD repeat-containing protein
MTRKPSSIEDRDSRLQIHKTILTYDRFGNELCHADPNGNVTTSEYDDTGSYPLRITNAKKQATHFQYYGVNGINTDGGLYGQMQSSTDPNGVSTYRGFDGFGRATNISLQNCQNLTPACKRVSFTYPPLGRAGRQTVRSDLPAGVWSEQDLDGFGRAIRQRASSPEGRIVETDVQFGPRGLPVRKSVPYFPDTSNPRWVVSTYDAFDRQIQRRGADGSVQRWCYGPQWTMKLDELGYRTRTRTDDRTIRLIDLCVSRMQQALNSFRTTMLSVIWCHMFPLIRGPWSILMMPWAILSQLLMQASTQLGTPTTT